jgi:hypothetical protein
VSDYAVLNEFEKHRENKLVKNNAERLKIYFKKTMEKTSGNSKFSTLQSMMLEQLVLCNVSAIGTYVDP